MANRESIWTNSDGLYVGFGTRNPTTNSGAALRTAGQRKEVVFKIDGATLSTAPTAAQLNNSVMIPAGSYIEQAYLVVNSAFTDVNGELNIGGYTVANATDDADGFLSAYDVANLVANFEFVCNGSYVGKVLATAVKIGAYYDTAAFTDGAATLTVTYIPPAN